ncbi:MAG: hypothetical protein SVY53_10690 [Chloroflexota bacterium]|nr:hypothetical protein [Chloroflexota bacterium]
MPTILRWWGGETIVTPCPTDVPVAPRAIGPLSPAYMLKIGGQSPTIASFGQCAQNDPSCEACHQLDRGKESVSLSWSICSLDSRFHGNDNLEIV